MSRLPLMFSTLLGLAAGGAVLAGDIVSETAPPPPRAEHPPAPRDGYVWSPGHWEYPANRFVWVAGSYISERYGARWVADRWEADGSHWRFVPGHWERP